MTKKRLLIRLLVDLIEIIDSSSEEDLQALKKMSISKLSDRPSRPRSKLGVREKGQGISNSEAERILVRLATIESREEARSFLEQRELSKASLGFLARALDLPVMREDTSDRLMQKIVEGAIGTRLNSVAIRGE